VKERALEIIGHVPVPESILTMAAELDAVAAVDDDVEVVRRLGADVVVATQKVDWHRDPDFEKYSLLYVLRNDRQSHVCTCDSRKRDEQQPVGTVLLLNIHRKHCLYSDVKPQIQGPAWAAAAFGFRAKPTPQVCMGIVNRWLQEQSGTILETSDGDESMATDYGQETAAAYG